LFCFDASLGGRIMWLWCLGSLAHYEFSGPSSLSCFVIRSNDDDDDDDFYMMNVTQKH
jgi:hypothetical protein